MRLLAFLDRDVPTMGVMTDGGVVPLASLRDFYADVSGWLRRGWHGIKLWSDRQRRPRRIL